MAPTTIWPTLVADRLLYQTAGDLTFSDLNLKRPNLILNASNVTRTRANFDPHSDIPYDAKRPLSDDDALHFSFTQQYFWRLLSDLNSFPLKYALGRLGGISGDRRSPFAAPLQAR